MKAIELKNYNRGDLVLILIIFFFAALILGNILTGIIRENWQEESMRVLSIVLAVCMESALLILIYWFIKDSRKTIQVTQEGITYLYGKKVLRTVKKEDIIAYGCFKTYDKYSNGSVFFCYTPVEEIVNCAKKYWHWRSMYRKKQLRELEQTPEGMWILQMSVYLRIQRFRFGKVDGVVSVNHMSKEDLRAIWQLWQRKPMLLGAAGLYPHEYL